MSFSDLSDLETFSKYLSPLPYSPNDFSRHPGLSVMLKVGLLLIFSAEIYSKA